METTFRAARTDDLDRLLEIHVAAYPDARGFEERRRNFVANPLGSFEDLVVAERGGAIVGHAFLFGLEALYGGRAVKTGGIASVAVAPEARGQGVAGALMRHLHVASDVRGDALTMLFAFRYGFYAKHGYGQGSSRKRLLVDPRAIPRSWRGPMRAARGDDRDAIRRAHERAGAQATGWMRRPEALWNRRFADERRHHIVAEGAGGLAGYVAFSLVQAEVHAATTLHVHEIVAEDDATRRALWAALGAMGDQIAEIEVEVDAADPIEIALVDPDARRFGTEAAEHVIGAIVGGPMVRVEDIPRAFEARGYLGAGAFDVVVTDADLAVHVTVADGRATVGPAEGGGGLVTTRRGLSAMLYGGLRPADAVRLGVAEPRNDPERRALLRADAALTLPPLAPIDPF